MRRGERREWSSRRSRVSSFGVDAAKVTLKRRKAPASSQGTVEMSFSRMSHWEAASAELNWMRCPLGWVIARGAGV